MITRTLRHPDGRQWTASLDGVTVTTKSGSRKHPDDMESGRAFEDELYARLAEGFLLDNVAASAGEPRMLRHLGTDAWTGVMAIATDGTRLIANSFLKQISRDRILVIEQDGRISNTIPLPAPEKVAFEIEPLDANTMLVDIDHATWRLDAIAERFERVSPGMKLPASFIATSPGAVAWYEHPAIVVKDRTLAKTILRHAVQVQMYGGHTPILCATLSADGTRVAYCTSGRQIVVLELPSGRELARYQGEFEMLEALAYTTDGRHLVALSSYGAWRVYSFDVAAPAKPRVFPKAGSIEITRHFALSPDGKRVAVATYRRIDVFSLETGSKLLTFRADLVDKQCRLVFVGRWLGVLTDLGCAGLYATD